MSEKVLFTWSGGKDSAIALHELQASQQYEITALLTTVTEGYDRISMHGVQRVLLEQQADALGLPLEIVFISKSSSNEEYESKMKEKLLHYRGQGVHAVVFGDIFLEDVRKYRENNLSRMGLTGLFPLWNRNTVELSKSFIKQGFRAITTCVDSKALGIEFAGRLFDKDFLEELPDEVDPCGENGEFHTFVFNGPSFRHEIKFRKGAVILRDNRFYYCELIPIK